MAVHLTDMEELVGRIVSSEARDYMSESLKCYQAGAFRACVVLSYIALFDDLRRKLAPLAVLNSKAKEIHEEIEKKAKDQEVFESLLADKLSSVKMIDAGQKSKLDIIIKLRNKAAHPSGVHASAEEARFVFFETIDKFLSQPQLQTTQAADAISLALTEGNFFPTTLLADFRDIVKDQISQLSPQTVPYLIQKLLALFDSGEPQKKTPAIQFLLGLAALKEENIRAELRHRIVISKGQSTDYAELITSILNIDPALTTGLQAIQRDRVLALVTHVFENGASSPLTNLANPVSWLASFTNAFGQESVWAEYETLASKIISKNLYDTELMKIVGSNGPIQEFYFDAFESRARSSQFDMANPAAKALSSLDSTIGASVPPLNAFRLIVAVTRAAEHHAWDSQSLCKEKFMSVTALKKLAGQFATTSEDAAKGIVLEFGVLRSFEDLRDDLLT